METIILCKEHLPKEKFDHSLRVAINVFNSPTTVYMSIIERELIFSLALIHDMIEDTDCNIDTIVNTIDSGSNITYLKQALELLTHDKKVDSYETYIKKIRDTATKGGFYSQAAFYVKQADMKDHLEQEETLTDALKEKYYPVIKYLL